MTAAAKSVLMLAPPIRGTRTGRHYTEFMLVLQEVVKPGSSVQKGETVAEFDRQYMLNRMDDYKAWVNQHESNLKRLRALLAVRRAGHDQQVLRAKATMEKALLDLKKNPILSAIRAERATLNYEEAVARYKELDSQTKLFLISETASIRRSEIDLRQTRMEYDRAQRALERMVVKSPVDGIAVMLETHRGHEHVQIQRGDQLAPSQPYMRIVDRSAMVVNASLNQVDSQEVRVGMEATVHFDAYPDLELPARVAGVGAMASTGGFRASWVRRVPVSLQLTDMDPRVIPDLSISADVVLEEAEDAVIVPRECLFETGDESFTWVRGASGWEKRAVDTGLASNIEVAVTNGLQGGETLAAETPAAQ